MTVQNVIDFAHQQRAQNLEFLIEFLRIPSISTGRGHKTDVKRAAKWLANRMREMGMHNIHRLPTAGHPIVYSEWLEAGPQAPTIVAYGHYDVQPVDPEDEWLSPPFEPVVRDGDLFARGTSDDKGQLYTLIAAAEAYLQTEGKLPINLKFFIEGEEEASSSNLEAAITDNLELLQCDAVVLSDTAFHDPQTPKIVTGVRGMVYAEIDIQGPVQDLHSGEYGGVAHNPLQVMTDILSALHDQEGRVAIPGFYDRVLPLSAAEQKALQQISFDEEEYRRQGIGAPQLWDGEQGYSVLERVTARPTFEIHGISGGFVDEGQKTVIPAQASAKVSMRLVPGQDPVEIGKLFEAQVHRLAPPTVQVEVRLMSHALPAVVDVDAKPIQAAVSALRQGFGMEPVFLRSGGTLPVVAEFQNALGVPVVMMGYGLPDDNLHAPNEKFKLDHFYQGIDTAIYFMHELA